jgi:tetratricopeptide (TPR) repeat protein
LSLLAAISNAAGFVNFTERLYSKFITLVEANLGMNEQFLAYYMIGIWYTEVDQHNKAIACFEQSIRLKESHKKVQVSNKIEFQEKPSEMLVGNCYYNIALCQRMINQVR